MKDFLLSFTDIAFIEFLQTSSYNWQYLAAMIATTAIEVIALWRVFAKAGERGFASLIPYYSDYVIYKLSWDRQAFLNFILYEILSLILGCLADVLPDVIGLALGICSMIAGMTALVYEIRVSVKLASSFGKGASFGWGIVLLPAVFLSILGFGEAKYIKTRE